jgi:hypothetical protein
MNTSCFKMAVLLVGFGILGFPRFDGQGEVDRTGNDDRASKEKEDALHRGV